MTDSQATALPAPGLARRLAAFVYESLLLFAVAFGTALVFSPLVQQRHALSYRYGLMAAVGLAFTAYFVYFWTRSGQTLAMQTWRLRVVDLQGRALTPRRALLRSLLGWLWFLPAVACASWLGIHGSGIFGAIGIGMGVYIVLALLHPERRFLHEIISGTRVVTHIPVRPQK